MANISQRVRMYQREYADELRKVLAMKVVESVRVSTAPGFPIVIVKTKKDALSHPLKEGLSLDSIEFSISLPESESEPVGYMDPLFRGFHPVLHLTPTIWHDSCIGEYLEDFREECKKSLYDGVALLLAMLQTIQPEEWDEDDEDGDEDD